MTEAQNPIQVLDGFIKSLSDAKSGFEGLVEKLSVIQLEAMEKNFDTVSNALGKPFSVASQCVEEVKKVLHDVELERNRLLNEKS